MLVHSLLSCIATLCSRATLRRASSDVARSCPIMPCEETRCAASSVTLATTASALDRSTLIELALRPPRCASRPRPRSPLGQRGLSGSPPLRGVPTSWVPCQRGRAGSPDAGGVLAVAPAEPSPAPLALEDGRIASAPTVAVSGGTACAARASLMAVAVAGPSAAVSATSATRPEGRAGSSAPAFRLGVAELSPAGSDPLRTDPAGGTCVSDAGDRSSLAAVAGLTPDPLRAYPSSAASRGPRARQ